MYPKYVSKLPLIESLKNFQEEEHIEQRERKLFNEKTFFNQFTKDLLQAEKEVVICSPFVTKFRSEYFSKIFGKLKKRNIEIFIFTRPIEEYDLLQQAQVKSALNDYRDLGINVFFPAGNIHEKIAVIDRKILWEGSLNILSQRDSREIMNRIENQSDAMQIMTYLGINKSLINSYKTKYEIMYQSLLVKESGQKKKARWIFVCGLLTPVVIWWLYYTSKIMLSLFRWLNWW